MCGWDERVRIVGQISHCRLASPKKHAVVHPPGSLVTPAPRLHARVILPCRHLLIVRAGLGECALQCCYSA